MDKEQLVREAAKPQTRTTNGARVVGSREIVGTEIRHTDNPEAYLWSDTAVNTEEVR